MKKSIEQLGYEAGNIEFELANELCPLTSIDHRGEIIHTPAPDNTKVINQLRRIHAKISQEILLSRRVVVQIRASAPCAPRTRARRRTGEGTRSSAASGDGNAEPEPDPERRQPLDHHLYDQQALADFLCISKKTLQNRYSEAPHTLPKAICVPGARGPRWTWFAILDWLNARGPYFTEAVLNKQIRKVGRPRIALVKKQGGAA